jgi:4-methyl-5(b-hydroxyethyl)-thiazole monophosphate biosynthesis
MPTALVLLAPGFEEIEAVAIVDVLRRADVAVTVAATAAGPVEGSHGIRVVADQELGGVRGSDFDVIVLPGGQPGTRNLEYDPRVRQLLAEADRAERRIAAICAAPRVLHGAGLLAGRRATSHPSVRADLAGAAYTEERVVSDGRVTTSRGPGTAIEFALRLVEQLRGAEKAAELARAMLVA